MRNILILSLICLFLLFSRFHRLSQLPASLVHDELIYVMQAKALALTGSDMTGTWKPWSLTPFNTAFAELPAVLMVPGVTLVSDKMVGARITHAVMGFLLPFLLGWLAYGIWKNKHIALITVVVAAVNPWLWQYSRMAFDPHFNLFFYLLAAGLILNFKNWWRLLAIPALFLGFFQYQGLKLVFIPWVILILVLALITDGLLPGKKLFLKAKAQILLSSGLILISSIAIFAWYLGVALPQQTAFSRVSQIVFFDQTYTATQVAKERRLSLNSQFLPLTNNKATVMLDKILDNTFKVLNPSFLFLAADEAGNAFSVSNHGYFYLIDLVLVLVGGAYLCLNKKDRYKNLLFGCLLASALIPSALATTHSFAFRPALFYLLILPLIAYGIYHVLIKPNLALNGALVIVYALSVVNFSYHYFVQYPIYAADGQFFVERILANYLSRIPKDIPVIIYVPNQEYMVNSYLFYNQLYTQDTALYIRDKYVAQDFTFDNLRFVTDCADIYTVDPQAIIIKAREVDTCQSPPVTQPVSAQPVLPDVVSAGKEFMAPTWRVITLSSIKDGGDLYHIYQDKLCTKETLRSYIAPQELRQLELEKLETPEFCQTWFSDLGNLENK